jgi:integrase/recombinase XerD
MLSQLLTAYLEVRRALGFDLHDTERLLRQYVAFATARGDIHVLAKTALDWCADAGTAGQRRHRLRRIVLFARYVRAEDPLHEVPPGNVFPRVPPQRMPYIYTPEEAARLVAEAEQLGPTGTLRPHTVATIFGLLFATGLRVSEALALRLDDVTDGGLVIRKTKFRKTRFIPLHDTARVGLQRYIDLRMPAGRPPDHVFLNYHGNPLGHRGLNASFREARHAAGLERPAGQPQPRVHDMRHTFAVRALEACPDGRDRIAQHMLALTTYLGHSNVADTYWYLHATPKLMRDIADACEAFFKRGASS